MSATFAFYYKRYASPICKKVISYMLQEGGRVLKERLLLEIGNMFSAESAVRAREESRKWLRQRRDARQRRRRSYKSKPTDVDHVIFIGRRKLALEWLHSHTWHTHWIKCDGDVVELCPLEEIESVVKAAEAAENKQV